MGRKGRELRMKTDSEILKNRVEHFRAFKTSFSQLSIFLEDVIHLIENVRSENSELRKENHVLRQKNSALTEKILKLEKMLSPE